MNAEEKSMPSIKEIYKIGRGPSSSHTMGPERACGIMLERFPEADRFDVTLYGSLAKTGRGHRTDYAIGETFGEKTGKITFDESRSISSLPHPNTMEIAAFRGGERVGALTFLSVGGGDIEILGEEREKSSAVYRETHFEEIERVCESEGITLGEYVERREGKEVRYYLRRVWDRMQMTIESGLRHEGTIPGGLGISRRAGLLLNKGRSKEFGHEKEIYLISAYAYAVGEENASGETTVTAPTCGASGVLPAVLYFKREELGYSDEDVITALEVAGLVGNIIKTNASISGAECGCQAEIGSACVMAAAALACLKGLTVRQIECAAEIALEHHLGLTCDPVGGLVQIPCIERNAVAAMRAVDAVSLAQMLYESRKISLDLVIKTMYETGRDLSCRYRETSEGGLAALYGEH